MGPRLPFHSFLVERISAELLSLIPWLEESRQYTFTAANTVKEKLEFAAVGPENCNFEGRGKVKVLA